jgi:hypothetical protein
MNCERSFLQKVVESEKHSSHIQPLLEPGGEGADQLPQALHHQLAAAPTAATHSTNTLLTQFYIFIYTVFFVCYSPLKCVSSFNDSEFIDLNDYANDVPETKLLTISRRDIQERRSVQRRRVIIPKGELTVFLLIFIQLKNKVK